MKLGDTIVAIATPPGRGGIGIVRLSGTQSLAIATSLVRLPQAPRSWVPVHGQLLDNTGEVLDDVLFTWFAAPRSYTSEDVVEIACHGAPVVLHRCVERTLEAGARLAEPGEFTLRAFLLGRIDLPQAEAVRDLIDATTLHQARVAAQQTNGSLARKLHPLKKQLIDLIALLEAGIDFAEDDISIAPDSELLRRLNPVAEEVDRLVQSFGYGQVLREGFSLAIVGQPNVGKSSLFNRLLESDRAIVTDIPGTTRDLVSESTALEGIPVRLVDTAGIREGQEPIETLGIERSYTAIADADLCLLVVDARRPELDKWDRELLERIRAGSRFLLVANKADLATVPPDEALPVSALTGQGIPALRRAIVNIVAPDAETHPSNAVITNLRQAQALREAAASFGQACLAITEHVPHEMLLLDLYQALSALDALTGQTTADDILHRIFATFCIGK